ncbi:hypothetical protein LAZ67_15002828 [Cordylochernes scorpioides]|uniref:Uncharacterized protein n=1 Tax=Cordylochernes scorpioides TaxID=51811 RepID=A0ABY6LE06_9ARAC|nr:hypothetical protein LAZ67_15002828 [Cordylochernes scorpioides]
MICSSRYIKNIHQRGTHLTSHGVQRSSDSHNFPTLLYTDPQNRYTHRGTHLTSHGVQSSSDSHNSSTLLYTNPQNPYTHRDNILRPVLLSFLSHHSGLTLQQDNVRPYTARVTMDYLQSQRTPPWPARSHELSPIEHI